MKKGSYLRKATFCMGFVLLMVSAVMLQIPGTVGAQEDECFQEDKGGKKMLKKIDHVGIQVKSIDESIKLYTDTFGLEHLRTMVLEQWKVKVAFFRLGDAMLELLEPTGPDSHLAKKIEAKGECISHIAYRVENIEEVVKELKKTVKFEREEPPVIIAPESVNNVLTELVEREEDESVSEDTESKPIFKKIDHVAIQVKSIDESMKLYTDTFGLEHLRTMVLEQWKVKVAFFRLGESMIELLEATEPDADFSKRLEEEGEYIAHIAYRVENLEEVVKELKKTVKFEREEPPVVIAPESANNIVTELVEREKEMWE